MHNKKLYRDLFSDLRKELGEDLRQVRMRKNMTLDEVYMETNVLSRYIDMLECGKRFNMELLRQLAYFYRKKIKISLVDIEK